MRQVAFLLISTVSLLTACVEGSNESTRQETELTTNRITANRITANRITANRITANRIAAERITANRLTVDGAADELIATADGRELFSVLVACAIPEDITLEAIINGIKFEFAGEIGLTPQWLHRPLDQEGQGWVSACVFAKVNAQAEAINFSMRGPNRALEVDPIEREFFPVEEGAFYGNMFTPLDQPILWIACRGRGQAAHEPGLNDRVCAKPDENHPGLTQCGFFFAGDCGDFSDLDDSDDSGRAGDAGDRSSKFACDHFSKNGEFYRDCHAAAVDRKHHPYGVLGSGGDGNDDRRPNHVFHEVITTYVSL